MSILGWLVAGYFVSWIFYMPSHLAYRNYRYDINEASQFAALCSVAWAASISWVIFSSFVNNEGKQYLIMSFNKYSINLQ